ncbi:ryncolin-2-like isoform X3 [Apostichopus japonicus]|uniref:ryncolin-2-like isoform X3 n=1 Tax=Stichopus japonicus TaxID=307972 RepID=UPI003AB80A70
MSVLVYKYLLFQTLPITTFNALNQYFISFHIYFDLLIATNLYSSKPVETTPKQTTSSETTGSTVREASESEQTTPMETTTGDDPSIVIKDCLDVFNAGNTTNGIYTIKPTNWTGDSFDVFCNMTDGGGWTVFQRRVDGSVDFYRNWTSYKEGFGDPSHEFWLGNDKLSHLTNQDTDHRLDEAGLEYHRNQAFSTYDRDNDIYKGGNCAVMYHGAWWYNNCHRSNLNGDYHTVEDNPNQGYRGVSISWRFPTGWYFNIKYTEMKIRPVEI